MRPLDEQVLKIQIRMLREISAELKDESQKDFLATLERYLVIQSNFMSEIGPMICELGSLVKRD